MKILNRPQHQVLHIFLEQNYDFQVDNELYNVNKHSVCVWPRFEWYSIVFGPTLSQWRSIHNRVSSTIQFASSEPDDQGDKKVILQYRCVEFYYHSEIAIYVYEEVALIYQFISTMQHDQHIGARLTTVLSLSSSCIFIPTKFIICLCDILRDEVPDSAPGVKHFYEFDELSYREWLREEKLIQNKGIRIYILNQNFKNHTKMEDLIELDDDDHGFSEDNYST